VLIRIAMWVGLPTAAPMGLPVVFTAIASESTPHPIAAAATMPASTRASLLRTALLYPVGGDVEPDRLEVLVLEGLLCPSGGSSSRRMSFQAVCSSTFSG
jgi:hypothetical protein